MSLAYTYIPKEKKYDRIDVGILTNFDYALYISEDVEQRA